MKYSICQIALAGHVLLFIAASEQCDQLQSDFGEDFYRLAKVRLHCAHCHDQRCRGRVLHNRSGDTIAEVILPTGFSYQL